MTSRLETFVFTLEPTKPYENSRPILLGMVNFPCKFYWFQNSAVVYRKQKVTKEYALILQNPSRAPLSHSSHRYTTFYSKMVSTYRPPKWEEVGLHKIRTLTQKVLTRATCCFASSTVLSSLNFWLQKPDLCLCFPGDFGGTLTGVQGDIRCNVLVVKYLELELA